MKFTKRPIFTEFIMPMLVGAAFALLLIGVLLWKG